MGCGSSKVDDLPLVVLCRERKELIRAAADHRYALASAHVAYFDSLKGIGDALHRFVNEELSVVSSSPSSPVLTLPPSSQAKNKSSSSISISHSLSHDSPHSDDSHLHFHSDSGSISGDDDGDGDHISSPSPSPGHDSSLSSSPPVTNYHHYMRSSTAIPTMVYQQPQQDPYPNPDPTYGMGGSYRTDSYFGIPPQQSPPPPPPPPPPPEVSAWDFLNPFDTVDSFYHGYGYPSGRYGVGTSSSSPDSAKVREQEGIPDLEDEAAEQEPLKEVKKKKKEASKEESGESTSKTIPVEKEVDTEKGSKSGSSGGVGWKRKGNEENARKKGVSFGREASLDGSIESARPSNLTTVSGHPAADESIESSRPSNLTSISTHRSRDIWEVVQEIKDQFEAASNCGKEVSGLLEAGKLQYRRRSPILEVFSYRFVDSIEPLWLSSSWPSSKRLHYTALHSSAKSREWAPSMKSGSLASTLEKLYAWEKKLYKEVKDEEKLQVIYERKCKQLKYLDDNGAESNKIDATQASIRKLLTKISIAIKAIDTVANRIHKLRDEELKPQLTELVQGLTRMWKNMVTCHQKQFQAILETTSHHVTGKTGFQRDSSMQAARELEQELLKWYSCFNNWICAQKAYVDNLNGWLLKCLWQEPEVTADGIVPFSPSRVEAPPVFIICNDWCHAFERISELEVLKAMHAFAERVHMLWELQDEEQRQKLKAEFLFKDFERRLKSLHKEVGLQGNGNTLDAKAVVVSNKDSIVLPDDERRAALDSMKKRLDEERVKHEEAVKQVQKVASSSLEMGLKPIFEAMDNFTSEILKAHVEVRIESPGGTS